MDSVGYALASGLKDNLQEPTVTFFNTFPSYSTSSQPGGGGRSGLSGYAHVHGGHSGAPIGTHEILDPVSKLWTSKAVCPQTGRMGQGDSAINGKFYTFGAETTSTNYEYDVITNTWAGKASTHNGWGKYVATRDTDPSLIHVYGGFSSPTYYGNHSVYDTVSNTLTTKASISGRYGGAAACYKGKFYVIGGTGSVAGTNLETIVYDYDANTWSILASPPAEVSVAIGFEVGGRIWYVKTAGNTPGVMAGYDPVTDTWSPEYLAPRNRGMVSCAYNGGQVMGGGDSVYDSKTAEVKSSLPYAFKTLLGYLASK